MIDAPHPSAEFVAAALPEVRTWPTRPSRADLSALPGGPALYLLIDAHAAPVQLATTQSLKRVLLARLADPQRGPRQADVAEIARGIRWQPLCTAFEGRWRYYQVARELYPQQYRRRLSFGPAWFLQVNWDDRVPELRVSERVWCLPGQFVGPWPTQRAARETLTGLWDLFDLCRYPEQVRKTPHGTRCAYAEMGRCDAPCDGSAPLPAYVERCRAAWDFVTGGCAAWMAQATPRMKEAAAAQNYELAAQIKKQVGFAAAWQELWSQHIRHAADLHFLLGFPAARRRAWKLFRFRRGEFTEGPLLADRHVGPGAVAWLRTQLADALAEIPPVVRMEQTWLLSQVIHGNQRERTLLLPLPSGELPADFEPAVVDTAARLRQRWQRNPPRRGRPRPSKPPTDGEPPGADAEKSGSI